VQEIQAVNGQLRHALQSRIVIEQAKGIVAERAGVTIEEAFARMRNYARNHNLKLVAVAGTIIDGTFKADLS
jgi:AmiR/NasT family two-component response regulator